MTTPALYFVVIYVSDVEASQAFFTETLGFTRVPDQDTPTFRYLTGGEGGIDFSLLQASAESPAPGTVELCFRTNEISELHMAWTGKGVEATQIVHMPFGATFSVHAPDGTTLTMITPPGQ